jgi:chitosanase
MDLIDFIKKVLLCFEQSSTQIKYDKIYTWNDGPNKIKQITLSFGITEYGNLKKFIQSYCDKNGKYKTELNEYISKISSTPLADNLTFINLLKEAAEDPVMQQCQEEAFINYYIQPALKWCDTNKFTLPLSKLVISDSFLHSGSILKFLRDKFAEKVPANGGKEKIWIEEYCKARKSWLSTSSSKLLRNTVYRPNYFLSCISNNDWELNKPPYKPNGVLIK